MHDALSYQSLGSDAYDVSESLKDVCGIIFLFTWKIHFECMALIYDKPAESQYFSLRNGYDGMLMVLAIDVSSGIIANIWSPSISSRLDKSNSIGRLEKGKTNWKDLYVYDHSCVWRFHTSPFSFSTRYSVFFHVRAWWS